MTDGPTTDDSVTDGFEDAWLLGHTIGLSDGAAEANRYEASSELAADWADGWLEGAKFANYLVDGEHAWAEWMTAAY